MKQPWQALPTAAPIASVSESPNSKFRISLCGGKPASQFTTRDKHAASRNLYFSRNQVLSCGPSSSDWSMLTSMRCCLWKSDIAIIQCPVHLWWSQTRTRRTSRSTCFTFNLHLHSIELLPLTLSKCVYWVCWGCNWALLYVYCTCTFCTSGFFAYDGSLSLSIFFFCWIVC